MKRSKMKRSKKKGGAWYNPWSKKSKTLKTRINDYVYKNDICCEKEIKRPLVIQMIEDNYKKMCQNNREPEEWLNWISNDLGKFIGYRNTLVKENKEGLELWDEIDNQTTKIDNQITKDKKSDMGKIVTFLQEVPLYFLLAFLGYSEYVEKMSQKSGIEKPQMDMTPVKPVQPTQMTPVKPVQTIQTPKQIQPSENEPF